MDQKTDALVQQVIRTHLKDRTVLGKSFLLFAFSFLV